jgi:hypothetical protein
MDEDSLGAALPRAEARIDQPPRIAFGDGAI